MVLEFNELWTPDCLTITTLQLYGLATPTPKYVLWFISPQEIVEPMKFFSFYGPKAIKGDFKILTLVKKKLKKEIKIIFTWGIVPAPSKFLYL